ncbi:protein of unknown function DUF343 [Thermocrinis albus DSM 14484]|uniref:UPF0434 protein Thal_0599 n=1 Tax=Thermocrinis albus (strain DSM 14484 / JCM 11386 / HI 11/12) TaxID=638303 RepID=D3SPZ6_THEAH|nr:Trm112 family protein [Thermocrinis albus]ADC89233.1 protein of unknown function DUF343 [Thermocrinis albus DSM 14484]
MALPEELLNILACPRCKGDLIYIRDKSILVCERCGVYYPVEDDIPVLLIEEAKPLSELPPAQQEF